jgi:hypothetical protein
MNKLTNGRKLGKTKNTKKLSYSTAEKAEKLD